MRLVVLPSGFDGSGFYRCLIPASQLRREGWDVVMAPFVVEHVPPVRGGIRRRMHYGLFEQTGSQARIVKALPDWLLDEQFDVLLMQQRDEPGWAATIRELQGQGKRVVVDSDDAWLHLPAWNPGSRKPKEAVDRMLEQVAAADGLSVATPALAEMYAPYQTNIRIIRNRLDWGMWADTVPVYNRDRWFGAAGQAENESTATSTQAGVEVLAQRAPSHPSWRRLRVGWMGNSFWRAGDLKVLQGVLGPWLEQHPEVEFVAAGDPTVHDVLGVPDAQRVSVAEVEFDNRDLADITATFDIGLVPLGLADAKSAMLNECKSHLKGLEYNAAGIPFIASPTESYRWYLANGGAGMLAEKPRGWRAALDTMLDSRFRLSLSRQGRAAAKAHTIQEAAGEWDDWLGGGSYSHASVQALAA